MEFGFAKSDITPRVGVELCGFGAFLNRHSIAVRDRLWARAMAVRDAERTMVLVGCDLIGVELAVTREVRRLVGEATGADEAAVMVHCTHTHSGPNTLHDLIGWGDIDQPYMELLPRRIARACIEAVGRLTEAQISQAAVPCRGIGLNRQYDKDGPPLEDVLRDDWEPAKPQLTDTVCRVLKVEADGRLLGFAASFGCHPVVCCQQCRYIHGDYPGVAMNMLERENPGSVGLFLQGAQGDVNSCVVHKPEQESLLALDVISARFANSVRAGLRRAEPLSSDSTACLLLRRSFARRRISLEELEDWLGEKEAVLRRGLSDEDGEVRQTTVHALALRRIIAAIRGKEPLQRETELQGFRIGPLLLLGAPFEIYQAIKNDVLSGTGPDRIPLVLGLTNDFQGYAPDRQTEALGGYAVDQVPMMLGTLPFADIHGQLSGALLELAAGLS